MFFDPRRYDLAKVGRYKFNKKLMLKNRITGHTLAEDVVSPMTGEVIAEAGAVVDRELADAIQNAAVPYVWIAREESDRNIKVLSNMMVDLKAVCGIDPEEVGVTELVYYPVLAELLEETAGDIDELKEAIHKNIHELIPKHITKEDIMASIITICILNMESVKMMILTTWVTDVSVRLENFSRISTESVFQDWKELFVKE